MANQEQLTLLKNEGVEAWNQWRKYHPFVPRPQEPRLDLREANLLSADLREADLREVDLSNADLRYANLSVLTWKEPFLCQLNSMGLT